MAPGQHHSVVAVGPARAGLERGRPLAVERDVVLGVLELLLVVLLVFRGEDVAHAAGVGEQVVDCDLLGDVGVGVVGHVLADRIAELQLALLGELGHGHRREHLVHRAEIEPGVEPVGDLPPRSCRPRTSVNRACPGARRARLPEKRSWRAKLVEAGRGRPRGPPSRSFVARANSAGRGMARTSQRVTRCGRRRLDLHLPLRHLVAARSCTSTLDARSASTRAPC